jgi:hypothetical protein
MLREALNVLVVTVGIVLVVWAWNAFFNHFEILFYANKLGEEHTDYLTQIFLICLTMETKNTKTSQIESAEGKYFLKVSKLIFSGNNLLSLARVCVCVCVCVWVWVYLVYLASVS